MTEQQPSTSEDIVPSYVGDRDEKGQRHGYGRLVTKSGDVYEGMFAEDKFHGHGVYRWKADGAEFSGEWAHGSLRKGRLREFDGTLIEGTFNTEGLLDGRGIHKFPDGTKFSGNFRSGKLHGDQCKQDFPDGESFVGSFVDGMREGRGVCVFPDRSQYTGFYVRNKRNGRGTMEYPDGTKIEGVWTEGDVAYGKYMWPDGAEYNGEFGVDGVIEGQGTLVEPNGSRYVGAWKASKRNGYGVFISHKGDRYEGRYVDDKKDDSKGRFISKDGSIYVGPFHRGRMHGVGVLVENGLTYNVVYENGVLKSKERADPPDSSQRRSRDFEHTREERDLLSGASQSDKPAHIDPEKKMQDHVRPVSAPQLLKESLEVDQAGGKHALDIRYEGDINDDNLPHGYGVFHWDDNTRYEGQWVNGNRQGQGTMFYANGSTFRGEWTDDREVSGVYTWSDGSKYQGEFNDEGKMHGQGTMVQANGSRYDGEFKDGRRCGWGVYISPQSSGRYEGFWSSNRRNGWGVFTWDDGAQYLGHWKDGKRHDSDAIEVESDGTRFRVTYENGVCVNRDSVSSNDPLPHVLQFRPAHLNSALFTGDADSPSHHLRDTSVLLSVDDHFRIRQHSSSSTSSQNQPEPSELSSTGSFPIQQLQSPTSSQASFHTIVFDESTPIEEFIQSIGRLRHWTSEQQDAIVRDLVDNMVMDVRTLRENWDLVEGLLPKIAARVLSFELQTIIVPM